MPTTAPGELPISTNEIRNVAVDFRGKLDSGELLNGTPTVEEVDGSDLVITAKAVNTVELEINGETVGVGQAVQFIVNATSATATKKENIDIVVTTDAGQTLEARVVLTVID